MNLRSLSARTTAMVIAAIIVVALLLYIPSCMQKRRSEAAQARVGNAQAQAGQESAKASSETQAQVNRNEVASETLGRDNEKEIRNAQGSDAPVAAPARDAGLASLCRRKSYSNSERCRLLNAR